ncbi:MAG: hypothetical protein JNM38_10035 [Acidobacteria bacterium]|nr:hypothetical protein [Acidobacteriota bacterium]
MHRGTMTWMPWHTRHHSTTDHATAPAPDRAGDARGADTRPGRLAALVAACLAVASVSTAQHIAGVTVHSVSSEYTLAPWDLRAIHVVDGSGLVGAGHDVTNADGNSWQTITSTDAARIVFDLGALHTLGLVHVWNLNFYAPYNGRGASTVIIRTSTDLSAWTSQGTYFFTKATGLAGDPGFDIDASAWGSARYVEFDITDIHGGDDDAGHVGLSEVRFYLPPSHVLSVAKAGTGTGTVTSTAPDGSIACGSTCTGSFAQGTTVTLAATPAAGSLFDGWTGACSGRGACAVTMDQARTVTATFVPKPTYTRYLAEGATSTFFDTRLALLNPGNTATTATLTFARADAAPVVHTVPVPARTRVTVEPKTIAGMAAAEFSTKVESDEPLVVDRLLSWDVASGYGAHAETAVAAPATTWYLAEGATHSGFNLFYLLQNPSTNEAQVRVRFLLPSGAPLEKTYTLDPASRTNIWVNQEEFPGLGRALAATDVSAVLESTNGQPFIVERALYLDVAGTMFAAGHESAGVTAPAIEWFLAEGNTGPYFDLFVLIANPGPTVAQVDATYLLPSGTVVTRPYTVAPTSRFNIWVDGEDALLADTAVSTTIRSTNGVPVIVERALWWPGTFGQWYEAHNSPGATSTGTRWAVAEGEVGGTRGIDTYLLLANTSAMPGSVKVTLLFEDGTTSDKTFAVAANSRFNVEVRSEFPAAIDRRFGAIVESLGPTQAQIVVESAMYWNAGGQFWASGTNALATKLP